MESVQAELNSKSHVQDMQGQAATQQDAHGAQQWGWSRQEAQDEGLGEGHACLMCRQRRRRAERGLQLGQPHAATGQCGAPQARMRMLARQPAICHLKHSRGQ